MFYHEGSKPNSSDDPGTLLDPLQTPSLEPNETSAVNGISHSLQLRPLGSQQHHRGHTKVIVLDL